MNIDKVLIDYSEGRTHLKNADRVNKKKRRKRNHPTNSNFSRRSLQYLLKRHNHKVLGMQLIESYVSDSDCYFYNCSLCGFHGKKDEMYKHLINDEHTDAYIEARIVLKCITITAKERDVLRKKIYKKDGFTVDNIKQFRGDSLFPYHLLDSREESCSKFSSKHHRTNSGHDASSPILNNEVVEKQIPDFIRNLMYKMNYIVHCYKEDSVYITKECAYLHHDVMFWILSLFQKTAEHSKVNATEIKAMHLKIQLKIIEESFELLKDIKSILPRRKQE